jgi:hypothetical protein
MNRVIVGAQNLEIVEEESLRDAANHPKHEMVKQPTNT